MNRKWTEICTFDDALDGAWAALEHGVANRKSAFHALTLATEGPTARIITPRAVDRLERTLQFNCDVRSALWSRLIAQPRIALTGFGKTVEPMGKAQIRIEGVAEPHASGAIPDASWNKTAVLSRRCYLSLTGPGIETETQDSGLPDFLIGREPTEEESAPGRENFGVVVVHIRSLEIYALRFEGHVRARFEWVNDAMRATWLTA